MKYYGQRQRGGIGVCKIFKNYQIKYDLIVLKFDHLGKELCHHNDVLSL